MAAGISLSLLGPAAFPPRSSGVCVLSSGPSPGSCCPCRFAGTQVSGERVAVACRVLLVNRAAVTGGFQLAASE